MKLQNNINATRVFNARLNTIVSISLVLLLTGIMLLLGIVTSRISRHVRENVTLSVIINDEMRIPEIKAFENQLKASPWAKSVVYTTKEKALEDLKETIGEDPEDLLASNPLLASFDIFLNAEYANTDSIQKIETTLKNKAGVEDIVYRKDLINLVNENIDNIQLILLVLAVLLVLISFSLIRNTVRLMIYSKRFAIRTMQLVGASNNFIRKPFLLENMWCGIISALLATGLLTALVVYAEQKLGGSLQLIDPLIMFFVFSILLVFSLIIILSATWLAVNRYLKMHVNDLYNV